MGNVKVNEAKADKPEESKARVSEPEMSISFSYEPEKISKYRQYKICQFETNPRTGEYIQDLNEIAKNLGKYKSFTRWAWAIHDKDPITQDVLDEMSKTLSDEAKKKGLKDEAAIDQYIQQNAWYKLGDCKGKHIHIALHLKSAMFPDAVAKLLGIPSYLVQIAYNDPKHAHGAFLDCVEYLTHESEKEQLAGKYRYPDEEVHANFDWRTEIDNKNEYDEKYGSGRTAVDRAIIDVVKYGKTVRQCYKEMDAIDYVKNENKLRQSRAEYLDKAAPLPNTRINFYFEGEGGIGKDTACELLARALRPDIEDVEDIAFPFGDENVSFDGYDGQPVIIWSDMRAADFMSALGRKACLHSLDIHPRRTNNGRVHVKFGYTRLVQDFNIINGIEPYSEFITELAKEYKDNKGFARKNEEYQLGQYYRRFPIIIPLREDDFDILLNKGVFKGTREYEQYITYKTIIGNFGKMQIDCASNGGLLREISKPAIDRIVEAKEVIRIKSDEMSMTEDEIRTKYTDVGKDAEEAIKEKLIELFMEVQELSQEWDRIKGHIVHLYYFFDMMWGYDEDDISMINIPPRADMTYEYALEHADDIRLPYKEDAEKFRCKVDLVKHERLLEEVEGRMKKTREKIDGIDPMHGCCLRSYKGATVCNNYQYAGLLAYESLINERNLCARPWQFHYQYQRKSSPDPNAWYPPDEDIDSGTII